ncbi:MAG: FKBP-type peptidyl-prolyl cis-trans isomerase [Nitrospira sp.]
MLLQETWSPSNTSTRLEGEQIIDTTVAEAPLVYTHGQDEILRGLEAGLEDMAIGAVKRVTVAPVDGYGETHPEGLFRSPEGSCTDGSSTRSGEARDNGA